MKSMLVILGVLCLAITVTVIHANLRHNAAASTTHEATAIPAKVSPNNSLTKSIMKNTPAQKGSAFPTAAKHQPYAPVSDPKADAIREAVDLLVSPNSTFQQREAMWHRFYDLEHLNPVIDALRQGVADHPESPEYLAALGKANLQKAGIVSQSGGSVSELGILGMTADQSFDAALKLDPNNWDAQFFKAVAMSYWPPQLNKGDEVIQRFSGLIDQQGSQSERPEFALPYIALGQQYQKLGRTDNALQAWQTGAAKFPNDATLQGKLAGAQPK